MIDALSTNSPVAPGAARQAKHDRQPAPAFALTSEDTQAKARPITGGKSVSMGNAVTTTNDVDLLGSAFPAGGISVQSVRKQMEAFAQKLNARLRDEGIDTSKPVDLKFNPDGSITAGNHPSADRIEKILAEDKELAMEFQTVVANTDMITALETGRRYVMAYEQATDDEERKSVWEKYQAVFAKIRSMSGTFTMAGGQMTNAGLDYAAGLPLG